MGGYAKLRALDRIRDAARIGLDVAGFLDAASEALATAVPNDSQLEGPYWYTLDPESRLITSVYGGEGCHLEASDVMRWEYLDEDVNKYLDVLDHPTGVQTLHEVTRGEPERSRIYRDYLSVNGIAQEMLVALRDERGNVWGTVRLNRLAGQPDFDAEEFAFMAEVAADLAGGIRRGLIVGEASDPDRPDAPGLLVLDRDGEIVSSSVRAGEWIERLPSPRRGSLPVAIVAAAAAALRRGSGRQRVGESAVLIRSLDGIWVSVHGSLIEEGRSSRVAVIVEPAHPRRIAPLLMAIYGLSAREQEVSQLVLHGWSTVQIAHCLGISPYTVQQHLKSIFEKVGVRTRSALVAALFYENFDARVQDNGHRVGAGRPIRGGARRRGH